MTNHVKNVLITNIHSVPNDKLTLYAHLESVLECYAAELNYSTVPESWDEELHNVLTFIYGEEK